MNFIEYLINKGYKSYRKVYDKNSKSYQYIPDNNINYFSSAIDGYIDIRLIKDDKEVVYGLHEYKHPPVLIWPKPEGVITDAQMDRFFMNNTVDEIFNKLSL